MRVKSDSSAKSNVDPSISGHDFYFKFLMEIGDDRFLKEKPDSEVDI